MPGQPETDLLYLFEPRAPLFEPLDNIAHGINIVLPIHTAVFGAIAVQRAFLWRAHDTHFVQLQPQAADFFQLLGLAVPQVYKIIKTARQADAAARQGGLFGDSMDDGR